MNTLILEQQDQVEPNPYLLSSKPSSALTTNENTQTQLPLTNIHNDTRSSRKK